MSVTLTLALSGFNSYRFTATSTLDDPTFYWYKDGRFFMSERSGVIELSVSPQTRIDVFDTSSERPQQGISPGMLMRWKSVTGAVSYRVERYNGATWDEVQTILETGARLYRVLVRGLADETTHQLRVVATDAAGVETAVYTNEGLLVRHPDIPSQAYSLTAGTLSVGA